MRNKHFILVLAVLIAGAFVAACSTVSGQEVFSSEICPTCHYFQGIGREDGIDLSQVGKRRTRPWINEHIKHPKSHAPDIGMPSFSHLSNAEINALVEFLTSDK